MVPSFPAWVSRAVLASPGLWIQTQKTSMRSLRPVDTCDSMFFWLLRNHFGEFVVIVWIFFFRFCLICDLLPTFADLIGIVLDLWFGRLWFSGQVDLQLPFAISWMKTYNGSCPPIFLPINQMIRLTHKDILRITGRWASKPLLRIVECLRQPNVFKNLRILGVSLELSHWNKGDTQA